MPLLSLLSATKYTDIMMFMCKQTVLRPLEKSLRARLASELLLLRDRKSFLLLRPFQDLFSSHSFREDSPAKGSVKMSVGEAQGLLKVLGDKIVEEQKMSEKSSQALACLAGASP